MLLISAFFKAIGQLGDPRILRFVVFTVLIACGVFAVLWAGVYLLLTHTKIVEIEWLEGAFDVLGGLATLVVTWFLFPGVLSAVLAIFLEPVAAAVEARHYPELPRAEGLSFVEGVLVSVKFLVVFLVLNVAVLITLVVPPIFPFVFYGVNGYLLGREYLELVALRREDSRGARALRRQHRLPMIAFGIAVAMLLTVPFVNLVVPIVATAAMVHCVVAWRRVPRPRAAPPA